MSHTSSIFENRKVQIKNKSGFDLTHSNFLTQTCGTLTPVCTIPMLPNDSVSLGFMSQIKLPPMATSFYGRVDYRLEAFFVPYRILWGGWENFVTMPVNDPYGNTMVRPAHLPNIVISGTQTTFPPLMSKYFKRGSLADYLGVKGVPGKSTIVGTTYNGFLNNALPFLAYHKIYDDWYRNANIQKPVFRRLPIASDLSTMPWQSQFVSISNDTSAGSASAIGSSLPTDVADDASGPLSSFGFGKALKSSAVCGLTFADGSSIFDLRQRNWAKDYFTTATLYPQQSGTVGGAGVSMTTAPEGNYTTFTISQLRQANILQKWLERNNIAGTRYADQIRATYGVMPSDAMLDRPIFLGASSFGIYSNSIASTSDTTGAAGESSNPFKGMQGSDAGQTSGFGKDSLIDKFTATEHGIIMVLGSVVPHATYSTGTSRIFAMSTFGDIPNPMFEGLGEEAILLGELQNTSLVNSVLGYGQQYAWMKYMNDEVHGLLVDGSDLQSFCLQRSFDDDVRLNSSFIQIPTSFLDQVMAVADKASGFCCWNNMFFDVKKTSLLSQYTIPTLGEPKNTHTETVPNTGRYL